MTLFSPTKIVYAGAQPYPEYANGMKKGYPAIVSAMQVDVLVSDGELAVWVWGRDADGEFGASVTDPDQVQPDWLATVIADATAKLGL